MTAILQQFFVEYLVFKWSLNIPTARDVVQNPKLKMKSYDLNVKFSLNIFHFWLILNLNFKLWLKYLTYQFPVYLAFREATTRSCQALLKVFRDTGWEKENGRLEIL